MDPSGISFCYSTCVQLGWYEQKKAATWLKCFGVFFTELRSLLTCVVFFFCAPISLTRLTMPQLVFLNAHTGRAKKTTRRWRNIRRWKKGKQKSTCFTSFAVRLCCCLTLPCLCSALLRSGLFLGSPLSELHTQHRARDHKVLAIQEVEEEGDGRREFDHFSNLSLSKCLLWSSV